MKHEDLVQIAHAELILAQPHAWDSRALTLFRELVAKQKTPIDEKQILSAFADAIEQVKIENPQLVAQYRKSKRKKSEDSVRWSEIMCVGGVTNGDEITLRFMIKDKPCVIEGTDIQWCDPAWVHRKLQIYTRQVVEFPFDKNKRDDWYADGLLPWLKTDTVQESEHKTNEDIIIETLRAYCSETLHADSDPHAFKAVNTAIYEGGIYYIQFAGFMAFVRRRTGTDHRKSLTNALTKVSMDGGTFQKRVSATLRTRFYRISKDTLYGQEPDSSDARERENDQTRSQSPDSLGPAWDSIDDELRKEERGQDEG